MIYTFYDKTKHSKLVLLLILQTEPAPRQGGDPPVGFQALVVDVVGGEETDVGVHPVLHGQLEHRQPAAHVVLHVLLQQLAETGHHRLLVAVLLRPLQGERKTVIWEALLCLSPSETVSEL